MEMNTVLDNHFMQKLESAGENITFVRVDSDTVDNLVQKDEKTESVLSEKEEETSCGTQSRRRHKDTIRCPCRRGRCYSE